MIAFAQYIPDEPLPVVSIIIPVYNSAKWIGRCLDSVVNQGSRQCEEVQEIKKMLEDMQQENKRAF